MKRILQSLIWALLPLMFIMFLGMDAQAQLNQGGLPLSYQKQLSADVPFVQMQEVDVDKLLAEDALFDSIKDIPWRFGHKFYVDYSTDNSGKWETLSDGTRVWRLGIYSPGAFTINLIFSKYQLAEGARLYVFNDTKSEHIGAFTHLNNQDDNYFATTLVQGDRIVIEYSEPAHVAFKGQLQLESITHAYRNPFDFAKGFGHSGSCNLNVACPQSAGWEDQIRSVGMLVANGNGFCSGALINNTNFDGKPYFLSANHCFSNPGSVVFWFNWQSPSCANPPSSPPYNALSGAVTRARTSASDFWLLELNQTPPEDYNVYYSGWNRTLEPGMTAPIIGIHHPSGDIKKFSFSNNSITTTSYLGNTPGTTHWRITWSGGTTTEGGSSGSPLYDAQGRIIGQLHGGYAACGNTQPDWYGKLGVSWTGSGTPSTRLSDWLDPNNTGLEAIAGYDPNAPLVMNPTAFSAVALSANEIQLSWEKNDNQNPVLIAFNTEPVFGVPMGVYSLGDAIVGGGTVVAISDLNLFVHSALSAGSDYFYKAWSFNASNLFSPGVTSSASTPCQTVSEFPFSEGFDATTLPQCWTQEYVNGAINWTTAVGNNSGYPAAPYSGTRNALFRITSTNDRGKITRLVSPPLSLGAFTDAAIDFYLVNQLLFSDLDTLKILYRHGEQGAWNPIVTFDTPISSWTFQTIVLPDLQDGYYIALEGVARRGWGIGIDQLEIRAWIEGDFLAPVNVAALVDVNNIILSWQMPDDLPPAKESLAGFKVYRNGEVVAVLDNPDQRNFTDPALPVGTYNYQVSALYISPEMESDLSESVEAIVVAAGNMFTLTLGVEGSGISNPVPGTYQYHENTSIALYAEGVDNFVFEGWYEGESLVSAEANYVFVINQNKNLLAKFVLPEFTLTLTANPENAGNFTGGGTYQYGQTVTVEAVPEVGYGFLYWKEGETILSMSPQYSFVITSDRELTGVFAEITHQILAFASPEEAGEIEGAGTYGHGYELTLMALPNVGWEFVSWKEGNQVVSEQAEYVFTVTSDRELTANFVRAMYLVSIEVVPLGAGNVTGGGSYQHGHELTVSAAPFENWKFLNWLKGEEVVSTQASFLFTVLEPTDLKAVFQSTLLVENQEDFKVLVYPNPAEDRLSIRIENPGEIIELRFYDSNGRLLLQTSGMDSQTEIEVNISSWPAGIYHLTIIGKDGVWVKKVLKKRS